MKKCPYCAEEVNVDAKKCKHCGSWLTNGTAQSHSVSNKDEPKPWIGGLGLLILVIGLCVLIADTTIGVVLMLIGGGLAIYALATGNIQFLGRYK